MHEHGDHCGCGEHHHDHHHEHSADCGCGEHNHDHHHEHSDHCGCGEHNHHHHHEHGEDCGCGHDHVPVVTPEGLTSLQVDVLLALSQRQCLPVACFTLEKEGNHAHAVALAPVYLGTPDDTMEQVKQLGEELDGLEEMGLISLDYDMPIKDYPYEEYKASILYAFFVKTVKEAAAMPGHLFDTAGLELGSMALTDAGMDLVEEILE